MRLDLPVAAPAFDMQFEVLSDGYVVSEMATQSVTELSDRLAMHLRNEREAAALSGTVGGPVRVVLAPDKAAAAERVTQVLAALQKAGVSNVQIAVASSRPHLLPAYPDPQFAADLKRSMAGMNALSRDAAGSIAVRREISWCAGAENAYDMTATAGVVDRCPMVALHFARELPKCSFTNTHRVVTAMQVLTEPTTPTRVTHFSVRLSPDGDALRLSGPLWSDAAELLSAMAGNPLNALPSPTLVE